MSVLTKKEFKSILSRGDLDAYLEYQYLSWPRFGFKKQKFETFSFLGSSLQKSDHMISEQPKAVWKSCDHFFGPIHAN